MAAQEESVDGQMGGVEGKRQALNLKNICFYSGPTGPQMVLLMKPRCDTLGGGCRFFKLVNRQTVSQM